MADGDQSTVQAGSSRERIAVDEIARPRWGTIVYRSVDDPEVLYVDQLISVGSFKFDVLHAQQMTKQQLDEYADGRLDFAALAHDTMIALNRPAEAAERYDTAVKVASTISPWAHEQVQAAQALAGQTVHSWAARETAIRSNADETHFEFTDPQVPCLQLWGLALELSGGSITQFGNYQNDTEFGLRVTAGSEPFSDNATPGHRHRTLDELPTGPITSLATRMSDSGDLTEIEFSFGDEMVLIVAGEISEAMTERLEFHRFDGSLLVFTSRADDNAITWTPPVTS